MLHPVEDTLRTRDASIVDARFENLARQAQAQRIVRQMLRLGLQILIFGALLAALFLRAPQVQGRSMLPNIDDGSHVLIDTLAFQFGRSVSRGDVVAFSRGDGADRRLFLKRVIGLPGERVSMENGQVKVDGLVLREPYGRVLDRTDMAAVLVPAGTVFVLGDDRPESEDSRSFGPVSISDIVGRASLVVWPLAHVGPIR